MLFLWQICKLFRLPEYLSDFLPVQESGKLHCTCVQAAAASKDTPVFFTGEMIFPWLFDDIAALRPFKEVAEVVARGESWSKLYDSAKLRCNSVPVASASYCEVGPPVRHYDCSLPDSCAFVHRDCICWHFHQRKW
jgi:hypothetical protein